MNKSVLLKAITASLRASLESLLAAARSSHGEAIDESTRSENKYDTRGLEASYLAEGQARLARETAEAITLYEGQQPQAFGAKDPIDLTALVRLDAGGTAATYYIGPRSGGLEVQVDGTTVVVITPPSPLGQTLMGKCAGQSWSAKIGGQRLTFRILSVE